MSRNKLLGLFSAILLTFYVILVASGVKESKKLWGAMGAMTLTVSVAVLIVWPKSNRI
jgi:hypothetical protein